MNFFAKAFSQAEYIIMPGILTTETKERIHLD